MANSIASSYLDILSALRSTILQGGLYQPDACVISLSPDLVAFPSNDRLLSIAPDHGDVYQPGVVGGGNSVCLIDTTVKISLWSRCSLDEKSIDNSYMTDSVLGLLRSLDTLIQTLQMQSLYDDGGNMISVEQMRLLSWTTPARSTEAPGWGFISTRWQIVYQQGFAGITY